ncbi:MAG TPA: hypothetical protein VH092_14150 [Urbifossiella sp.]|nr:hypothetical protein [Urbifossiella sp.]
MSFAHVVVRAAWWRSSASSAGGAGAAFVSRSRTNRICSSSAIMSRCSGPSRRPSSAFFCSNDTNCVWSDFSSADGPVGVSGSGVTPSFFITASRRARSLPAAAIAARSRSASWSFPRAVARAVRFAASRASTAGSPSPVTAASSRWSFSRSAATRASGSTGVGLGAAGMAGAFGGVGTCAPGTGGSGGVGAGRWAPSAVYASATAFRYFAVSAGFGPRNARWTAPSFGCAVRCPVR